MRYKILHECDNGHVKQVGKFMKSKVCTKNGIRYVDLYIHYYGEVISHYANLEGYFRLRVSYDPSRMDDLNFIDL